MAFPHLGNHTDGTSPNTTPTSEVDDYIDGLSALGGAGSSKVRPLSPSHDPSSTHFKRHHPNRIRHQDPGFNISRADVRAKSYKPHLSPIADDEADPSYTSFSGTPVHGDDSPSMTMSASIGHSRDHDHVHSRDRLRC